MFTQHLDFCKCPACGSEKLKIKSLKSYDDSDRIEFGVVWCEACLTWYPIEDGVLDLLIGDLEYSKELLEFWEKYDSTLTLLNLQSPAQRRGVSEKFEFQLIQQEHSDFFADNDQQTYSEYANTPFWNSVDKIIMEFWEAQFPEEGLLLEIGCGQGRFTTYLYDRPLGIIAFDLSKKLLIEASKNYTLKQKEAGTRAKVSFMAADGMSLPMADSGFDSVMVSGVLHHLPEPRLTFKEISRVLKEDGLFFGTENNATLFRGFFDFLMRIFPLWTEVAGPEALISRERLLSWAQSVGMSLKSFTHVFLPPHLVNFFSRKHAYTMLKITDAIGRNLPLFRNNGGLITFVSVKKSIKL